MTTFIQIWRIMAVASFAVFSVHAKTTSWSGTDAWPGNATNWSAGIPDAGDSVILASGTLTLTNRTPALASFTQSGGTLVMSNWATALVATNVAINGGVLSHPLQSALEPVNGGWVPDSRIRIICSNFTLKAGVTNNLSARGFRNGQGYNLPGHGPGAGKIGGGGAGGGGYGGAGGDYYGGGLAYGDPGIPSLWPGSGGGDRDQHAGGHGGGLFVLEADGHVVLNGAILVNGGDAANYYGGGGGSGGGVHIRCATLAATNGLISANGGNGGEFRSGSGGGGRIAISISNAAQNALPTPALTLRARFGALAYGSMYGDYGTFWLDHTRLLPVPIIGTYGYFTGPVVPDGAQETVDLNLGIGGAGELTLTSHGHCFVTNSLPVVNKVVLESSAIGNDGFITNVFEDASLAGPSLSALSNGMEVVYAWGAFRFEYAARSNRFDVAVTLTNRGARTIANLDLRLMEIAFPDTPKRSGSLVSNLDQPGFVRATWGVVSNGVAMYACLDSFDPLQIGLSSPSDPAATRCPLVIKGGLVSFAPGDVQLFPLGLPRVAPGGSMTLNASLRFKPLVMPDYEALADFYAAFRAHYAPVVSWNDRRPIGAIFFESRGHISDLNPRGWFNEPNLDVFSPAGNAELKRRFMLAATNAVNVLKGMGDQGMIVWNVEGEEFPHAISYIGDPRLQALLSPELNGFIDDYFRVFREAGLRTGVTLRPTQPYPVGDGTWAHGTGSHGPDRNPLGDSFDSIWPAGLPWQKFYPIVERLSRKITFARDRWGATIFYVDTTGIHAPVGTNQVYTWMLLDHWIFRELKARYPDSLFIPEYARGMAGYAVVAPYDQLDFTQRASTPDSVRRLYPESFEANYVANTAPDKLATGQPWYAALVSAVGRGDVLMHHGWYGAGLNENVRAIYREAALQAPCQVYINGSAINLNGVVMTNTAALTAALQARFAPVLPALPDRRVKVGFVPGTDIRIGLNPVLDAIIAANGIVAWSEAGAPLPVVVAPAFSPDSGAFFGNRVAVTVACATAGATIRHTTDGSEPSETSAVVASGGTVAIRLPGSLKAKAWKEQMDPSPVKTALYQAKGGGAIIMVR